MPLGSVKVVAFGAWMAPSGGYLRPLGEGAPLGAAGAGAVPRPRPAVAGAPGAWVPPRPAVGGAGFSVLGAPGAGMPPPCARAATAKRRMPRMRSKVFIADLRFCAPAAWAAAEHRTGRAARYTPWCGRWPQSSGWLPAAPPRG